MQFVKKTSSRMSIVRLIVKLSLAILILIGIVFLLNKIDFPSPEKKIEKVIPNENFKIIK